MITVDGRLAARIVMILAGVALAALGTASAISNRVTGHEALAGLTAFLAGTAAAAWLRRDTLNRRRPESRQDAAGDPPACPYGNCHHNHPERERGQK